MGPSIHFSNKKFSVVGGVGGVGGKVNLMSAPGPCLVQGAIGPGARDRGLALDNCTPLDIKAWQILYALVSIVGMRDQY